MSKNKFPPKNKHFRPSNKTDDKPVFLYGLHTVFAALSNQSRKKIRLSATANALIRLKQMGDLPKIEILETSPKALDKLLGSEAVHQGLALEVDPIDRPSIDSVFGASLLLVLDQVSDPHNVGAILRSACAFGADAVITTARYAPGETGVLAKSASGALDYVPFIEVTNLSKTLEQLKKDGMTIIGFDSEAPTPLTPKLKFDKVALVLGAEGKGLRQKTRETCDQMVKLDMSGPIKSLNVSNAAAIALYALTTDK